MKQIYNKNLKPALIFFLLSFILILISASGTEDIQKIIQSTPAHQYKNFTFDPNTAVIQRIRKKPDFILTYLKELDSRKDYSIYTPTKQETAIISEYINKLPPLNRKTIKERLLAVYFINNFTSSGLTEWAVDENGRMFAFMVFNPNTLKKNITELLSFKEKTNFIPENNWDIKLDCGTKYSGFFYIFIHESTHVVDYVHRITPFVEPAVKDLHPDIKTETPFTLGYWNDYNKPETEFPYRSKITFYGMGKDPVSKYSEAPEIYKNLVLSPFPTLYSSISWAEDLAEFVTFYHLTEKLHQKFSIQVYKNKKPVFTHEPMNSPLVRKRFDALKIFYQEKY
jgi:hypothetical protein